MHRLDLAALLIVCSFAFWHSGARADALCEDERFVSFLRQAKTRENVVELLEEADQGTH